VLNKKSILVVDDDKAILKGLVGILQTKGYDVDTAESGAEAISKAKAKTYNLALLDIKLPDMEGTRLLIDLGKITPSMMKIMVTGYASLDNAIDSVNFGADAYLMKPVSPEKLLDTVASKLKEQEEVEKMTDDKVAQWIDARLRVAEQLDKAQAGRR
jgi:DNA-binding NtrC family response regulator